MSLLTLLIILIVIGLVCTFIDRATLIHPTIRRIIFWVLIIVAFVLVLYAFGIWDRVRSVGVPKI